jgi:3-oxoacyl-[acyl-carrier protein] reductase
MGIVEDVVADGVVDRVAKLVEGRLGHLDILINNAVGSRPMPVLGMEVAWEEAILLNFSAGRRFAQTFVPGMRSRKLGRIINITGADEPLSMNAAVPPNGAVHTLSRLVGGDGVTVNCIPQAASTPYRSASACCRRRRRNAPGPRRNAQPVISASRRI